MAKLGQNIRKLIKKGSIIEKDLESIAEEERPIAIIDGTIYFNNQSLKKTNSDTAYIFNYNGKKSALLVEGNSLEFYVIKKRKFIPVLNITTDGNRFYLDNVLTKKKSKLF